MGFVLFWMGVLCVVLPFIIGAVIEFGMGDEEEEDYMIGDDEFDWGDKP